MSDIPLLQINNLIHDLSGNSKDNANFSIFEIKDTPDRLIQGDPFRNDFYALIFVTKGELNLNVDFNTYRITNEMVFFVSPGQVSSTVDKAEEGFGMMFKKEFLMIQGSSKWLQDLPLFHRFHSNPFVNISNTNAKDLSKYLNEMLIEYRHDNQYKFDAIKSNLILTLIYLSRRYKSVMKVEDKEQNHTILRFESLIDQHYQDIKTVKEYAEMLFMTPQNLNRITKKMTGKSASDLINEKVLIEIKRHLLFTNSSIEEIAYHLNFYDNSYFTKYFKKATGMTPKAFRTSSK